MRITFRAKQVKKCPHHGEVAKKPSFFTEHLPVTASGYCNYFLLEMARVDVRLKKKKIKFFKDTLKKTLTILNRTKKKQQLVALHQ